MILLLAARGVSPYELNQGGKPAAASTTAVAGVRTAGTGEGAREEQELEHELEQELEQSWSS